MAAKQQIRSIPPVNRAVWAFSLGGLVRHPLSLSFADLAGLPSVTIPVTTICTTCQSIDTADYTGVPVESLLDLVELSAGASNVLIHAYDGYSTLLPLVDVRAQAVIAYAVNGEPLTHDQGYPARLVIPGKYGYKMPKWVTRIELTDHERGGFWEETREEFTLSGDAFLECRITGHERLPNGAIRLSGFVYARPQSAPTLKISLDHSAWMPIPYSPPQTRWQIDWLPPYPNGVFSFRLHARDRERNLSAFSSTYHLRT